MFDGAVGPRSFMLVPHSAPAATSGMALHSRHETRGSESTVPERPDPEEELLDPEEDWPLDRADDDG
ncbi:unnamed protein product [Boreogadus saida]